MPPTHTVNNPFEAFHPGEETSTKYPKGSKVDAANLAPSQVKYLLSERYITAIKSTPVIVTETDKTDAAKAAAPAAKAGKKGADKPKGKIQRSAPAETDDAADPAPDVIDPAEGADAPESKPELGPGIRDAEESGEGVINTEALGGEISTEPLEFGDKDSDLAKALIEAGEVDHLAD